MVSQERWEFLYDLWSWEDPNDPESMEWREELDDEETALVESWDQSYDQGVGMLARDILEMGKGR